MTRLLLFLFATATIFSCSTSQTIPENRRVSNCKKNFKNDFSKIEFHESFLNIDNKTEKVTEAKFFCLYSFLQTKKVMFDIYGKWNTESVLKGNHHPLLIWSSIPLLEDSSEKFIIITTGEENYNQETYASISILDENGRDALAVNSEYKSELIKIFSDLIRNTNHEDKEFYKVYLKQVSPKKWKKLYSTEAQ
ncbi:hypothetical protein [Aequorivita viscosa]|uniref:Lipoprotein n=1 Tax=Aequorivita viscosa TaxID=797419 RepID=A0A1M6L1Z7_9FLAO|nr:hypothetical protein [Aequorivita viscosa]SDX24055.1 hypothetical protein SAMN05216556_12164 [Aequorivita viscosa]SHJ65193.1 hypothetical protein SAMN04487908_1223 [Aequorivita viscosa]